MNINSEALGKTGFLSILSHLVSYSKRSPSEYRASEKDQLYSVKKKKKKNHCCLQTALLGGTNET